MTFGVGKNEYFHESYGLLRPLMKITSYCDYFGVHTSRTEVLYPSNFDDYFS